MRAVRVPETFMRHAFVLCLVCLAAPLAAQERIGTRDAFVERVAGRELTRLGIGMTVTPDGAIAGNAFGGAVRGSWTWEGGFFCREMAWGDRQWPRNCQLVQIEGDRVRFVADRGEGDSVYLSLP